MIAVALGDDGADGADGERARVRLTPVHESCGICSQMIHDFLGGSADESTAARRCAWTLFCRLVELHVAARNTSPPGFEVPNPSVERLLVWFEPLGVHRLNGESDML